MLKMIGLVPVASEVILRPPEGVVGDGRLCFEAVVLFEVFKCFLCACAANNAGHKATASPPQELDVKRLVPEYIRVLVSTRGSIYRVDTNICVPYF